jgi:predicted O-linked N-acetylglucosamine transferase (SPINDLY family)
MEILRQIGEAGRALDVGRELVKRFPSDLAVWNEYLFTMAFAPGLTGEQLLAEHRAFGARIEEALVPMDPPAARRTGSRLRVGYVSADFRRHPVYCFVLPLLSNHDRTDFEIFCYYNHPAKDEMTERLRDCSDHWRDVASVGDEELATLVRTDEIDILVDLSGHTAGNRLGVFARRPAQVQFTWLGYLGTTGLSRMDFRLCDRFTDPEGIAERWQSEVPVRLPDSQWCYEPPYELPPAGALPRLERGHWTFGSFNQIPKLSEPALIAWARVLLEFPDSRLIVLGVNDSGAKRRVLATLVGAGVHESRIDIRGRVPIEEYFRTYQEVDVALDTFPYNGGTTTCDALALGVPVAAVAGSYSVSRSAVSLLSAVGLQEWVANDVAGLPGLIRARLADPGALSALRQELPSRFRSSALMDAARFTKGVEDAFRVSWNRRREGSA